MRTTNGNKPKQTVQAPPLTQGGDSDLGRDRVTEPPFTRRPPTETTTQTTTTSNGRDQKKTCHRRRWCLRKGMHSQTSSLDLTSSPRLSQTCLLIVFSKGTFPEVCIIVFPHSPSLTIPPSIRFTSRPSLRTTLQT